ncbi:hypothetical protein BT96DRAFT_1006486 [Gymnopus androsaceus JB14]|uniref:DUF455-domain-containing protein n=1 Tax=Gymnopus androsaceus JB14 TaxID=1447944 RepID=A0A6A4GK63_9AGAR|nr:hypothetical protein BT96DRAFT_1006486 [Gymnopus androsaceus JB14]
MSTPRPLRKFRKVGDKESIDVLEVIHADEVTHVTAGHRWFMWMCEQKQKEQGLVVDPVLEFREEVRRCWCGDIKGPFNIEDRENAGMSREFYEDLKGEMPYTDTVHKERVLVKDGPRMDMGSIREALPEVQAEYEPLGYCPFSFFFFNYHHHEPSGSSMTADMNSKDSQATPEWSSPERRFGDKELPLIANKIYIDIITYFDPPKDQSHSKFRAIAKE